MNSCNAEFLASSRTVFPLTSLSIGFWSSRKSRKVLLLSLPIKQKFVLLSVEDSRQKASGRLDKALSQVNSIWDSRNPFNACSPSNANDPGVDTIRWVVAFEVEWSHIIGIDYRFCLLQEGRLVLETSCVVKRVFKTIEDVHAFYEWTPPDQDGTPNDYQSPGSTPPAGRRNTYSGGYDRFFFHPSTGFSGQWEEWQSHWPSEESLTNSFRGYDSGFDGADLNSSSHYDMLRAYAAGLTPRGSSQHTLGNLPCTPPRLASCARSWPSSQLCEALHLMGATHKDTSSSYRTPSIPGPARFTLPSALYSYQTVILGFSDPHLLSHLAAWVKADVSRVKLYESGLPSWAVFLPSYGLWYHPWMRTAAWVLYMAISIFSMACGFYDLYKNVPYLKQVVSSIMARLHLPRYALLEWLEHHAQIRLSILLTYMFSKSPLFASFLRLLTSFLAVSTNLLQPMLTALAPMWDSMSLAIRTFTTGCSTLANAAQEVCVILLGPPVRSTIAFLCTAFQAASEVLVLIGSWTGSALLAPLQLLMLPVWALLAMFAALLQGMQASSAQVVAAWRAFRATWGTVKAGSRVVKGGLTAAAPVVQSVPVLSLMQVPGEALDMLRMSFVKVFKALQAVIRFLISLVLKVVQHRFSLTLQAYRYWATTQTSILTKLRSFPWLSRLLPEPAPPPQPEVLHPLTTTSLTHSGFAFLHPPLSSLSRSSSSSSIHDTDATHAVREHSGSAQVRSHAVSLRPRAQSATDSSLELSLSWQDGADDGGLSRGRLSSWHEGDPCTSHGEWPARTPPVGAIAHSALPHAMRHHQSFSAAIGITTHHARHRRVRSDQMWDEWFDTGQGRSAPGCMSADAMCRDRRGSGGSRHVDHFSGDCDERAPNGYCVEGVEGVQKPRRSRSGGSASRGELRAGGKRAARQIFVPGVSYDAVVPPDAWVREKVVRMSTAQTSPSSHTGASRELAMGAGYAGASREHPNSSHDAGANRGHSNSASHAGANGGHSNRAGYTATSGGHATGAGYAGASREHPTCTAYADSSRRHPTGVRHAGSPTGASVHGVHAAIHQLSAPRERSVAEASTWGVTNLPWASHPSLQLHKTAHTHMDPPPVGQRMPGAETAPASASGETLVRTPPRGMCRTWATSGLESTCFTDTTGQHHAGVSLACSCGARVYVPGGFEAACCQSEMGGEMCSSSSQALESQPDVEQKFHLGSATSVATATQVRRRKKKKKELQQGDAGVESSNNI